jgi:hypothetical protein
MVLLTGKEFLINATPLFMKDSLKKISTTEKARKLPHNQEISTLFRASIKMEKESKEKSTGQIKMAKISNMKVLSMKTTSFKDMELYNMIKGHIKANLKMV